MSRGATRASRRGAAMVEAAVIIPVIVVFFGVMAMIHAKTKAALQAQHHARTAVMYYASNNCEKRISEDDRIQMEKDTTSELPKPDSGPEKGFSDATGVEERSFWFFAEASAKKTASTYGRTQNASSKSWALCNESPNKGTILGLVSYAFEFFGGKLPEPIRRFAK